VCVGHCRDPSNLGYLDEGRRKKGHTSVTNYISNRISMTMARTLTLRHPNHELLILEVTLKLRSEAFSQPGLCFWPRTFSRQLGDLEEVRGVSIFHQTRLCHTMIEVNSDSSSRHTSALALTLTSMLTCIARISRGLRNLHWNSAFQYCLIHLNH